jgi:hypothetical protein
MLSDYLQAREFNARTITCRLADANTEAALAAAIPRITEAGQELGENLGASYGLWQNVSQTSRRLSDDRGPIKSSYNDEPHASTVGFIAEDAHWSSAPVVHPTELRRNPMGKVASDAEEPSPDPGEGVS